MDTDDLVFWWQSFIWVRHDSDKELNGVLGRKKKNKDESIYCLLVERAQMYVMILGQEAVATSVIVLSIIAWGICRCTNKCKVTK